jgi:hypothetical protein
MRLEPDKVKENQTARNLQGKGGVEALIDITVSQKGEMGNKGSKERARKQRPRIKYPERPLEKMLKCWDNRPCTKRKKKQRLVKYCCFIWTQEQILKPLIVWPKLGSDEDLVCQLLIEYVNDKSPATQEVMEYAFCWRQSPVVLFPLKKGKKTKRKKKNPNPS